MQDSRSRAVLWLDDEVRVSPLGCGSWAPMTILTWQHLMSNLMCMATCGVLNKVWAVLRAPQGTSEKQ